MNGTPLKLWIQRLSISLQEECKDKIEWDHSISQQ